MVMPLAGNPAIGHILGQAAQPGSRCSQGGVKVPTGGKGEKAQARERLVPTDILLDFLWEKGSADSV
jgi:hypothetical protein